MKKKNLLIYIIIFVVLLAATTPAFVKRVTNEADNKDVIVSLNLNNADMLLSDEELDKSLEENKKIGVETVLIGEESLNSFINAGMITAIKYNVLCHKYDDESEEIIKNISGDGKIHNDSYVIITKRDDKKEHLKKWMEAKYNEEEYCRTTSSSGADVYVIYEGVSDAWHVALGFDEKKINIAKENDLDIVLSIMLGAYSNVDYVNEIEKIIKDNGIKYINIKKNYKDQVSDKNAEKNYNAFCKLIKDNGLYLILTEEQTQLSNQKPIGYDKLIKSAEGRVLRGYETIDVDSMNTGSTLFDKRSNQIVNSVVDRNIRFVTVNQLYNGTDTIGEKSEKTNISTKVAIEELKSIGYNLDSYDKIYRDYNVNRTLTSSAALALMILMCLMMLEWLAGKNLVKIEILALAGAVMGIAFTFLAPDGIVLLYPTLFATLAPCFAITAVMVYMRDMREKMGSVKFTLSSVAIALVVLLSCITVQMALLSGLDYYLNSLIFRGIKLSLIVPILYSAVIYALIFRDNSENMMLKIKKAATANIKVYWLVIAAVLGGVAAIYLIRSGNVQKISGLENLMRNAITRVMPARPRTKEFLVGWPCLLLAIYYIKNTNCTILRWCFAVGSSILFASVINTACHVFTGAEIIYMRVINGVIIGAVVSAMVLIVNHIAVTLVKKHFNKEGH